MILKSNLGMNPLMMLTRNYAGMLFEPENEKYFLSLIPDALDMQKCSKCSLH